MNRGLFVKFAIQPKINNMGEPHRPNLEPKGQFAFFTENSTCPVKVKAEQPAAAKKKSDGTFGISQHSHQICKASRWRACFQPRRTLSGCQRCSPCSESVKACHSGCLPDRHVQPATQHLTELGVPLIAPCLVLALSSPCSRD